jgi:hypothetical protein
MRNKNLEQLNLQSPSQPYHRIHRYIMHRIFHFGNVGLCQSPARRKLALV